MDCSEVETAISKITKDYVIIESDISVESNITDIYDKVESTLGQVNILINNAAGYPEQDSIFTIKNHDIKSVYDTTVQGTIMMLCEFIKRGYRCLIDDGDKSLQETAINYGTYKKLSDNHHYGRIVNFSTDSAQVMAAQLAYDSSKAAVEALTFSMAMEVGYLGVTFIKGSYLIYFKEDAMVIQMDKNSLAHIKWNCKCHIIFAPKYKR